MLYFSIFRMELLLVLFQGHDEYNMSLSTSMTEKKNYNTRKSIGTGSRREINSPATLLNSRARTCTSGCFAAWSSEHTIYTHQTFINKSYLTSLQAQKKIQKLNLLTMGFSTHKYQKAWVYIPALFRSSCVTRADLYEPFELKSPTPNRHHPSSITTYVTRPVYFSICCSNSSTLAATPLRPQCFTILK